MSVEFNNFITKEYDNLIYRLTQFTHDESKSKDLLHIVILNIMESETSKLKLSGKTNRDMFSYVYKACNQQYYSSSSTYYRQYKQLDHNSKEVTERLDLLQDEEYEVDTRMDDLFNWIRSNKNISWYQRNLWLLYHYPQQTELKYVEIPEKQKGDSKKYASSYRKVSKQLGISHGTVRMIVTGVDKMIKEEYLPGVEL